MNMKRNAFIALVVLIAVILLSGCPVLNTGKHPGKSGDGGTYTVSFSVNGGKGTPPADRKVAAGSSVILPDGEGLSKNGFNFGGWNTKADGTGDNYYAGEEYTPTGNITLYAEWDTVYTVTFNGNGGIGTAPAAEKVVPEESVTLPDGEGLSKVGFNFIGWNTKADGTGDNYDAGDEYAPESSITLYAKWVALYTVTFDPNGGSGTPPTARTVNAGFRITIPYRGDLTKTGFAFGGWNTKADGAGDNYSAYASYAPSGNITLYVTWIPQGTTYTVTYNLNGGSGTTPGTKTQSYTGGGITLPSGNGLSKAGFVFDGWNTKADGMGIHYSPGYTYIPIDNITLYVRWTVPAVMGGDFAFREEAAGCILIAYTGTGGAVNIPAAANGKPVIAIADGVFHWGSITSVTIPDSVTIIGFSAFLSSSQLASVTIGNGVTTIEDWAFAQTSLIGVTIPDNVTTIGSNAFINNSQLKSVTIGNGVTTIGDWAFAQSGLTNLSIGNGITTIGEQVFSRNSLTSVVIPDSVTFIGDYAFEYNQLISVTIGGNVTVVNSSFDNGFEDAYNNGGKQAGTYTRPNTDSEVWTKQ